MRTKMSRTSIKTHLVPVYRMTFIESMKPIFGSFEGTLINKLENLWDKLDFVFEFLYGYTFFCSASRLSPFIGDLQNWCSSDWSWRRNMSDCRMSDWRRNMRWHDESPLTYQLAFIPASNPSEENQRTFDTVCKANHSLGFLSFSTRFNQHFKK